MTRLTTHKRGRGVWLLRVALCVFVVAAVLAAVEFLIRKTPLVPKLIDDIVDIQTPATLAAKVRQFAATSGPKVVLLGDSLVAGRVMSAHGDRQWRQHTLSADLQRRFDSAKSDAVAVANFAMDGLLPADMETLVDALLPLKLDAIVLDVSLRSFSRDFAAEHTVNSRSWLKPGLRFRQDGSLLKLPGPDGAGATLERGLLNRWTTYRVRDVLRARLLGGEPRDVLQSMRDSIGEVSAGDAAAAEMRLLLQVRGRYASTSLDVSNPQYAAWVRMLEKLKAANQKTVIFYATENPRLLGSLIEPGSYRRLTEQLRRSVTRYGEPFRYLAANDRLSDEMFLDHVHVNAEGYRIYGERICAEIERCRRASDIRQSLALTFLPFLETVDPKRTELGRIDDFSKSASVEYKPGIPRFDLKGFPVLSVETRGSQQFRDIIFFYHWWDATGLLKTIRDSYHMLRAPAPSIWDPPESALPTSDNDADAFVDVFTGIPARAGTTETAFFLQDFSMKGGAKAAVRTLTLFGHAIDRVPLPDSEVEIARTTMPATAEERTPDEETTITFAANEASDISGRGVRFRLEAVDCVYTVLANHRLQKHDAAKTYLIGAMLPQVIGYRTVGGDYRILSFSGADLIRFEFDPAQQRLIVDTYVYDFRERSTRGSRLSRNRDGARVHPNLGIVNSLPSQKLIITHSRSEVLAFPLWQPNGALASLAITEHADFIGVLQDSLTMYGSETRALVPGKGILGNGIPLTKTVFPEGPQVVFKRQTASSPTEWAFAQPSVLGEPTYRDMLREYRDKAQPVEIGIHCVSTSQNPASSRTGRVAQALEAMREFRPVTWVDHGGRDCLWEAGWDPESEFYIIPVLRKNGFKYVNMLGDKYDGRLNMIADNQPSNLLFYSVGLDDDLTDDWRPIAFNTVPVGFTRTDFTTEHLQQIVNARGLVNVHTYLPYEALHAEERPGVPPKLRTNTWYDQMLSNIAAAGKSGDLRLATTEELNDFMWKVRALHVYARGRQIGIANPRAETIHGLTLGYLTMRPGPLSSVTLVGVSPAGSRQRDGVSYIWFDLKP
jgi:hypothetical protein